MSSPSALDKFMGTRLRQGREHLSLGKSDVARALGLSEQHYDALEDGRSGMSGDQLIAVAAFFKVKVSWFVQGFAEEYVAELNSAAPTAEIIDMAVARRCRQ